MMKGVAITSTYCKRSLRTALTAGALELDFMTRTQTALGPTSRGCE